jgi:DNA-binding HxlR family transcriptional regulator
MLILREAFRGTKRFDVFQTNLGVGRNLLSDRLGMLVEEGILDRVQYQDSPERFEYRLTGKGQDLYPVLVALMNWGDRYTVERAPVRLIHDGCGHDASPTLVCGHCQEEIGWHDVHAEYEPGAWLTPADAVPHGENGSRKMVGTGAL